MQRRVSFWLQFAELPRNTSKKHLGIAVALALVAGSLYYIGDGFPGGDAGILPLFLYGQAYHELVLLLFSGIVIYAAFVLRIRWALAMSFTGFFIMLPHVLLFPAYPDPMYRFLSWLTINILLAMAIGGILNAREQQQIYLRDIINAQEQERHRLSRELHDDTAQGLIDAGHAIDEMLEPTTHLPRNLATSLHSLRQDIDETLERTRRAIQGLQPPLLDEVGIKPALLWLCDSLSEESGIEVDTDIDLSEERLTQEAKIVLFRVTQEALNNIKKHSGASRAEIGLKVNENRATLTISDNGVGFVPPSRGKLRSERKSGLIGVQERVGLVHGSFVLHSKVGEGTTIRVDIPLLKR
ncbi:MAG: sensor histidine kinase [Dehalococcoidales bacterium]